MRKTIVLPIFRVEQPIGEVYVAKINATELFRLSSVDRRHIDEDDEVIGVQRPLRLDKVREIKKYLTTQNATFPNSIIVNVKKEYVYNLTKNELELIDSGDTFTIIDGQHRLYGFEDYTGRPFELILTIFIGLDVSLQSEVFSIINSQQTKVDPSLNINSELSDKTDSPRKVLVRIAQSFNVDKDSPWYQQIRMLGSQSSGIISLAAFVRPLFGLTYPEKDYIEIKNRLNRSYPLFPDFTDLKVNARKYPFWSLYNSRQWSIIYKILWNYFKAMSQILQDDWLNDYSILNKTTGYNAVIKLFGDILELGLENGDLSEAFFFKTLSPLSKLSGSISSEIYGASGLYASNSLYKDMRKALSLPESSSE